MGVRAGTPTGPTLPLAACRPRSSPTCVWTSPARSDLWRPTADQGRRWLATVAEQLHQAGLPVEVLSDVPVEVGPSIEVQARSAIRVWRSRRPTRCRSGRQHPPHPTRPDRTEPSWRAAGQAGIPLTPAAVSRIDLRSPWSRRPNATESSGGRNHRRTDVWQHRRRPGHRRRSPRLPLHLHDA